MHDRLKQTLIAGGLIALASSPALAGEDHGRHHKKDGYWEYLDTDGNGQVTREEFMEHAEQRFTKVDENGDSVITKEEFEAKRKKHKHMHDKHMHDKKMRTKDRQE